MKITDGSYLDYIFLFGEYRTAYTDICMKNSLFTNGHIYIAHCDNKAVGYIITENSSDKISVSYAFTVPQKRNCGVFSLLLKYVSDISHKTVDFRITENSDYYEIIKNSAEKIGFVSEFSCIVYSCKSEDFRNWEEYMQMTGNKFCDILIRQGFVTLSFSDLNEIQTEKLLSSCSNEFENQLDIRPYLENPNKCLDKNMSFITLKNNEIAAYTLVSCPDEISVVFEQISSAKRYISSGVIILPFSKAMESFKKHACKRASYAMYENNIHANAFRYKLLEKLTSEQKRSINFIYKKEKLL